MLKNLLILLIINLFSSIHLISQTDTWLSFWNSDSTLIGFKNKEGNVKIEPQFTELTRALKFDNIIAVSETNNETSSKYYYTKSGNKIGWDSLYFFDNTVDCESEGFIRFRDKKENVGMFNQNGKVVIPATYNWLTQVNNGMVIGLKGAKKEYWEKYSDAGCNHFKWIGGQKVLIDTTNKVLIADFNYENDLNFFSLEKMKAPSSDPIRVSFLGKDQFYYTFIEYEKEFKQWITKEIENNFTLDRLISLSQDSIIWSSENDWIKTPAEKLIRDNFDVLKNGISEIIQPKTEYFITSNELNYYLFEGPTFEKYFNNCGESKKWIYPVISIIISHKKGEDFTQNHFDFLRTENGYRLISLSIKNNQLK